jgi:hypothetical protein
MEHGRHDGINAADRSNTFCTIIIIIIYCW